MITEFIVLPLNIFPTFRGAPFGKSTSYTRLNSLIFTFQKFGIKKPPKILFSGGPLLNENILIQQRRLIQYLPVV